MKLYNLKQNIIKWSIITIICAAPSFLMALDFAFAQLPMIIGIIIVAVGYIILNSTRFGHNILPTKIYLYKSLKIAVVLRIIFTIAIGLTALVVLGNFRNPAITSAFFIIGMILGAIETILRDISVYITEAIFNFSFSTPNMKTNFIYVLFTTLIHASLVSLCVFSIAIIIWCFIRIFVYLKPSQANK
jgi:hypothetical protein